MRWLTVTLALLAASALLSAADDDARAFTFSKADAGRLPKGWKADHTGKGEGSVWKVVADDTAPSGTGYVLAQTAANQPSQFFNLCVAEDAKYSDLDISVSFKAVQGKEDQGGGVVWRYKDADNYYICRMNPLESNFRVYKVEGGKRTQFATKEDLKVPAGEWHTIRATMKGEEIECFLDGKKYLEARDATFKDAGKVGLWSKADAQTRFDGLKVRGK
jgi:hypothetical protein